ncbi:hypothetical protein F0U61_52015 [Archangium violaceum]|uniref:SitI3 family protein n=1 Tax=Archangium violaceum TaxID=83451 RepID=UPI002B2AEA9D|nr:hypothetical protein F0U61_52015 [Archangium violaceum]
MALDYDLDLSTHLKPTQALEKLAGHLAGLAWSEDKSCLFNTDVTISANMPREGWRRIIERGFQFIPTLSVGFRRASDANWDKFRRLLLEAALLLLEDTQDAVLLFNGENIVLQQLGGKLIFNADSSYWADENWLKSRLTVPFERRSLQSPLL